MMVHVQVPDLGLAREAYMQDLIDLDTFERLASAALSQQATDVPVGIMRLCLIRELSRRHDGPGGYWVPVLGPGVQYTARG
jgi:hypothetical protein